MRHWLRIYSLMLKWQVLNGRTILPFVVIIQMIISIGTVVGLGLLFRDIDLTSAKYLTTGGATLVFIILGMTFLPGAIAQAKERKAFDYIWSLPVPRMTYLAADLTIWLAAILPGVAIALFVGSVRYGFKLEISPWVILAVLVIALAASFIGNTIAHLSPSVMLTSMIANVIILNQNKVNSTNSRAPRRSLQPGTHLSTGLRRAP